MDTRKLEFPECFDEVKIPKIETLKKDDLINLLTNYSADIWMALFEISGMQSWFDIYLLSPEFQELDRDRQKKTLELFRKLRYVLEGVDDFMDENQLGEYNSEYYQWQIDRK
ncbi:hypothetical protein ACTJIV_15630 [Chryseobacterium sp. 22532]|uniref:hypothetical protein n=1 Tax=Chryseobacterium sp. 22532 TaxID=3453938 RepID=UPI003F82B941